jgi:hypothetical protein
MDERPIERQEFEWGVQLTAKPFEGDKTLGGMSIYSEITLPRPNRGCIVKITFSAALISAPLGLQDAQIWENAMSAILAETRTVVAEMKAAAKAAPPKKKTAKRKK